MRSAFALVQRSPRGKIPIPHSSSKSTKPQPDLAKYSVFEGLYKKLHTTTARPTTRRKAWPRQRLVARRSRHLNCSVVETSPTPAPIHSNGALPDGALSDAGRYASRNGESRASEGNPLRQIHRETSVTRASTVEIPKPKTSDPANVNPKPAVSADNSQEQIQTAGNQRVK